ncbi:MAG: aldo/keto reductase [Candidatus Heimdallarchaeota archaeon]
MNLTIKSKVKLNNGTEIPWMGLGVYRSPSGPMTQNAVKYALEAGYIHVDTAKIYRNEQDVGRAIKNSPIPREDVWVTTKIWNADHGFDRAINACGESLNKLGFDYIDLLLIHWPVEKLRLDTWRAMETLADDGKCKSIGVSNYMLRHLEELLDNCSIPPVVNQIELSPYNYLYRKEVVDYCRSKNIVLEAYSPLTKGRKLNDPKLVEIATIYSKSPAQILIRWALQQGFIVIPKSTKKDRIQENGNVFDFEISEEDIFRLESFDEGLITGWDPTDAP